MRASCIGLAVFLSTYTSAQNAPSRLTLDQAMRSALAKHPSLQRALHLTGAAKERVREAQAGIMPSLAIQSTATNGPAGAPAMGLQGLAGDPLKKHYGTGLNLIQPIYDFGRTQHLSASRRMLEGSAREDEDIQRAAVLLNVQAAYMNVLRAQQLVGVQQDNVRQRSETLRQAQAFADAGLKADVDAQLARANLADARVALIAAQNGVRAGFAALNNAMGETKLTEYELEPSKQATDIAVSSAESLMTRALEQRPEMLGAGFQVRAADQSVRAARSELLPRLDGIGSVGYINPSKLISDNKPFAVGAAVTIPIFTGGLVEGKIAEEKQKREAVVAGKSELEEAVKLQVARAWLTVQTREEQLKATQEQLTAANSSLQQATERYRLQLNTFVEVITAEVAATRARAAMVDATYDLELARADLNWAIGATVRRFAPVRKR